MTQWLVEEAVYEAVEIADRFRGGQVSAGEPAGLSPHEAAGAVHAELMARAQAGQ